MLVVRETFTARPGQASRLARLLKEVMAEMTDHTVRVLTDYIADFNTVVVEVEVADLATFDQTMDAYAKRTDIHERMKGYTEMYTAGRREVYRLL